MDFWSIRFLKSDWTADGSDCSFLAFLNKISDLLNVEIFIPLEIIKIFRQIFINLEKRENPKA